MQSTHRGIFFSFLLLLCGIEKVRGDRRIPPCDCKGGMHYPTVNVCIIVIPPLSVLRTDISPLIGVPEKSFKTFGGDCVAGEGRNFAKQNFSITLHCSKISYPPLHSQMGGGNSLYLKKRNF